MALRADLLSSFSQKSEASLVGPQRPGSLSSKRLCKSFIKLDLYGDGGSTASTCVGVEALLLDGALVEIDVTALVDD